MATGRAFSKANETEVDNSPAAQEVHLTNETDAEIRFEVGPIFIWASSLFSSQIF